MKNKVLILEMEFEQIVGFTSCLNDVERSSGSQGIFVRPRL
jgi:hypothetical protein